MDKLWKIGLAFGLSAAITAGVAGTSSSFERDFRKVAHGPAVQATELDAGVCSVPEKLLPSS